MEVQLSVEYEHKAVRGHDVLTVLYWSCYYMTLGC